MVDKSGNQITPIVTNFFTNSAMAKQVLPLPGGNGLTPGDEMFIQLACTIQPSNAVRIKSMGVSSYTEPFNV